MGLHLQVEDCGLGVGSQTHDLVEGDGDILVVYCTPALQQQRLEVDLRGNINF